VKRNKGINKNGDYVIVNDKDGTIVQVKDKFKLNWKE
jgi:hypothetical protein